MQHTSEVDETFGTYTCNMCVKYIKHQDKNTCNLQHENTQHKTETAETFQI
jgi:hypothetical protein